LTYTATHLSSDRAAVQPRRSCTNLFLATLHYFWRASERVRFTVPPNT